MKYKFYKAKHYWKDAERATWSISDGFDDNIFEQYKNSYETLGQNKPNYIEIDGKTLFLFYQDKKDYINRPIVEIVGLYCDAKITDKNALYEKLLENSCAFEDIDECNDTLAKYVVKNKQWLPIAVIFVVIIAIYLYFNYGNNTQRDKISSENQIVVVKKSKHQAEQKIQVVKSKWHWDNFCNINNMHNRAKLCYEIYIQQKCILKEKNKYTYSEFILKQRSANCAYLRNLGMTEDIDDLSDYDQNINESLNIKFFKRK